MMSSAAAGGDAFTVAGLDSSTGKSEENCVINLSDEKPKTVQRRLAAKEAGKRQRSVINNSYTAKSFNTLMGNEKQRQG